MADTEQRDGKMPVLVVDDDDAVRLLYARALERAGFTTMQASDGATALSLLETTRVGLMLIDNKMPGMTGMEVITELRANHRTRTLPVVLVTGTDDVPARIRGLEAGANDYVVKTTHLDEIVARVRAQVRAHTAWADALGQELEERARVVTALGSVAPGDSPEETAAALVEQLSRLPMMSFISLLHMPEAGSLAPLAGWAATKGTWTGGAPLASEEAAYLIERGESGPWMTDAADSRFVHSRRYSADKLGRVSMAPLRLRDRMLGLLMVGTLPGASPLGATGDLLAATIDYAAVATALLAPSLEVRGRQASERRGLEGILADHAFRPVFQPLVDLSSRDVLGFEALTRFADGTRPDLRFRAATELGMGREFEEQTIGEILNAAARLPSDAWLCINVTPELILQPRWLELLFSGRPHRFVVELTEHAPIDDYQGLRLALRTLPAGVSVAVDDAGAGYASLRHIYELRPQFVKLDMALVRDIDRDPVRQALVAGLVHFAEDTGSRLIAEGIESEREASVMRRLNVGIGQGYLFGEPAEAEAWVGRGGTRAAAPSVR